MEHNGSLQLSTPYTDPERHDDQCHRETDGQTDCMMYDTNSHSYRVTV